MSITIATNEVPSETTTIITKDISYPETAEQKEVDTAEDEDYNPNDDTDQESEDVSSDEPSEEPTEVLEKDEETIVNSIEFQSALAEALENVKYVARCDIEAIFNKTVKDYIDETGEEPTVLQMTDAFQTFTNKAIQKEETEVIVSKDDEEEFIAEFNEAIEHIKQLGKIHQESFVDEICETFIELNGKEPTIEELKNVFESIKHNFADEAREEFIEINNEEEDSDSDYDPNNEEDEQQVKHDKTIDQRQKIEIVYVNESETESEIDESQSEIDESQSENETENKTDNSDDSDDYNDDYY